MQTPASTQASPAAARCDPAGLATAAAGVEQTDRLSWPFAIAAGLRLACGDRLPREAVRAFEEVERGKPDPARVAALPERVDQLVDISSCGEAERRRLAAAYAQLRRDARHRVSRRIRVIEARGGVPARDSDVEVSILPEGAIEFDGTAIADIATLERRLSEQALRRRLVLVIDEFDVSFGRLRELVGVGRRSGFAELGLLVAHDGVYRVFPLVAASAEQLASVRMTVDIDGFFLARPGESPRMDRPADVPPVKPGAPLDDAERWDFQLLEQRIDQWTSAGARPPASLTATDDIWVRDVVAAGERVRGPQCAEDGGARCKVATLEWVF